MGILIPAPSREGKYYAIEINDDKTYTIYIGVGSMVVSNLNDPNAIIINGERLPMGVHMYFLEATKTKYAAEAKRPGKLESPHKRCCGGGKIR